MTPRRTASSLCAPLVLLAVLAAAGPARASDAAHDAKPAAAHAPAAAHKAASPAPAAHKSAAVPGAAPAPAAAAATDDSLDKLRERLAQKLGATKPPDSPSPHVMRVTSKPTATLEHGEMVVVPSKPAAKAARSTKTATDAHGSGGAAAHAPHWAYGGEGGPQAWGGLQPEFMKCATGTRQSPIDIRGGIAVDLEPVVFDYRASSFSVIDNGHTVQVNVGGGNSIVSGGRRYDLVQFHFHRPSEERIDGRQFDMVAHLVHKDSEGRLAVVAVLLDRGSIQPLVQTVWNNLPLEKNEEVSTRAVIDLNHLLPPDRRYYTYMGSLTTPPCSEGVLWLVLKQPVPISPEQIEIFSRLYPMNARPVQSASGRMIKQSN
jgi:carbonic anhydrase